MKRMGRYLKGRPRMTQQFLWQEEEGSELEVLGDTDHAGCRKSRKTTTGGAAMWGRHCIRHWSKTQSVLSLSSGESELTGAVKATAEALGLMSLMKDLGLEVESAVVALDSAAALGVIGRSGVGKIRHLDVGKLWLQQK